MFQPFPQESDWLRESSTTEVVEVEVEVKVEKEYSVNDIIKRPTQKNLELGKFGACLL